MTVNFGQQESEPTITINGKVLTSTQAMTIRVAIENFASDLRADGLGNDEHGRTMTKLYLTRIDEIRKAIFG
jgi:hypothetical protein